jgi:quinohemoprotein ethanol dehydrogenase
MKRLILNSCIILTVCHGCGNDDSDTDQVQKQTVVPELRQPVTSKADIDARRIIEADREPGNWLTHGRTYDEQRFSPLSQINDQNIDRLGLAWYLNLGHKLGLEVTPLVVDGVMYFTSVWNIIYAVDARSGAQLWRYDPGTRRDWTRYTCCGNINRGLAVWKGKLYEGTLDGRLVAVDAATGKLAWEVQTTDINQAYSITGAPRVVNGKVIIGNGGAEYGIRGYVTAYDAESGSQVWRFYTVPGNPADGFESPAMEMAAKTWSGEWWKVGGGGTAWDSFAFDPELNLLYIGTGNGGPWSRDIRSPGGGDNLFLASIVAVNADTGEYVWHYQTTPGENWDYTAAQQMILAELEINGEQRKVIMQAPKNGFFYVIDRATGELLSAVNIVPITWASHVDMKTGRPVELAESRYRETGQLITPGPNGAHDWQSMSFNPGTGLVYLPIHEMSWIYSRDPNFKYRGKRRWNGGSNPEVFPMADSAAAPATGALLAWDPVNNSAAWKIELGIPWNGGVLSTAGNLVIEGAADGRFVIYRADTGVPLWEMPINTGAVAAPVTYMVNGEQYIAIAAGWAGAMVMMGNGIAPIHRAESRILAFKLDGTQQLPAAPDPAAPPHPPASTATAEVIGKGGQVYGDLCGNCHGFNVISGGTIPDLRHMTAETHAQFRDIVLGGIRLANGMASFADLLTEADAAAIHAYIISRANTDWNE